MLCRIYSGVLAAKKAFDPLRFTGQSVVSSREALAIGARYYLGVFAARVAFALRVYPVGEFCGEVSAVWPNHVADIASAADIPPHFEESITICCCQPRPRFTFVAHNCFDWLPCAPPLAVGRVAERGVMPLGCVAAL